MTPLAPDPARIVTDPRFASHEIGDGFADVAVSWPAIIAGAFVTAALGLILLAVGAGAGLSSLSPWSTAGVTPAAVGMGALVWLAVIEMLSCGLGGYIAGRLRTKWIHVHPHEVHFRDTAHGFLVWAVALVVTAGFLTSAASTMVGAGAGARGMEASRADEADNTNGYFVDRLFRPGPSNPADTTAATGIFSSVMMPATPQIRALASLVMARGLRQRALDPDDQAYLARLAAAATGLSQTAAQQRVGQVFDQAQQALDTARKAAAHVLYWLFVALLLGAFSASWMATIGGRHREHLHVL